MDNDQYNLAYDFNVTELSAGSYAAVFHAEPYRQAAGCWGDSVAVRYASSPDGYFGSRAGDCNDCPGDHVITRTSTYSHMMASADCTGLGGLSGGGNPILIRRQGSPAWTLFYLAVSDYDEVTSSHDGWWRHYLLGQCVPGDCVPACGERECGPDPECGLTCGECRGDSLCNASGRCPDASSDTDGAIRGSCGCEASDSRGGTSELLVLWLLSAIVLRRRTGRRGARPGGLGGDSAGPEHGGRARRPWHARVGGRSGD